MSRVRALGAMLTAVTLACLAPSRAAAQDAGPDASANTCLRFTFGAWTPTLDWARAGHEKTDTSRVARDAEGRGWAAPTGGASSGSDTVLVLYPAFWPAGVAVSLGARELARGDTVLGRATALVADANTASPVAKVRAWRVPCGRAG